MNAIHFESDAAVSLLTDLVPPATLTEARAHRDDLARLLGREREATADFLLALADFDRRRGWEPLGHASLFAFLTRALGLSNGAAWLRLTAARLLPRFPAVETALRQGRLCLSAVGELSRVLTPANEAEVLPRFFGRSSREAREVAAAILPCANPPRRDVVAVVPTAAPPARTADVVASRPPSTGGDPVPAPAAAAPELRAHEGAPTHPARGGRERDDVEPLTAELRRLHVTVSARFLEKVAAARDGLSHARPGATTEQVLEAALDMLLEKQARSKALVKRPRAARPTRTPTSTRAPTPSSNPSSNPTSTSNPTTSPTTTPNSTSTPNPRHIPAPTEREVRLRDSNRCQFPLDAGGVCGSTWQIQLDHVVPRALDGPTTVANLRCACARHNRYAAVLALGPAAADAWRRRTSGSR